MKLCIILLLCLNFSYLSASDIFTSDRSKKALSHPIDKLDDDLLDQVFLGRSFFTIPWVEAPAATTARDGLGPLFNANTCVSCHRNNGGGESSTLQSTSVSRSILFKLTHSSKTDHKIGFQPDPIYGVQLAINGNHGIPFEGTVSSSMQTHVFQYPDNTQITLKKPIFTVSDLNYGALDDNTNINPRRALSLTGLGLIEQIPAEQIIQRQDKDDINKDGISGKINSVWSPSLQQFTLGRYGWKATTASLIDQTANALINDMGLTSPLFIDENCTKAQTACQQAFKSKSVDVPMLRLQAISTYISHLKAPKTTQNLKGQKLFKKTGCLLCHQNKYKTIQGIELNPYSDFLLHDMGKELADKSTMFQAQADEWRTPPLWGLGLSKTLNPKAGLLHDGRANSIEEAILWHGGEAQMSKQKFIDLTPKERTMLLSFLAQL